MIVDRMIRAKFGSYMLWMYWAMGNDSSSSNLDKLLLDFVESKSGKINGSQGIQVKG